MTSKPVITLYHDINNGKDVLALKFAYHKEFIRLLKANFNPIWNGNKKYWYIDYTNENYQKLIKLAGSSFKLSFLADNPDRTYKSSDKTLPDKVKIIMEKDELYDRLYVHFPFSEEWKNEIKKLDGAWWHTGEKVWSVALSNENISNVKTIFKDVNPTFVLRSVNRFGQTRAVQKKPLDKSIVDREFEKQLKLLNRSKNTINNYMGMVAHFLYHFQGKDIASLPEKKIKDYIHHHRDKQGYSESYQRLMISALKSYYKIVYKRLLDNEEIPFPKKAQRLPKVISQKDVEKMIRLTVNPKHRMILLLLYGLGLRNSELSNLQLNDIDFKREIITIYNAKGRKDRQIPLPDALKEPINRYIRDFAPKEFFITGQYGGQYSGSSIDKVVKQAARRARVKFNVTPHVLRHCFATHSLEKGIDLRYIQIMLGHKSSRTTEIYTHVSTRHLKKVGNPLDDLNFY